MKKLDKLKKQHKELGEEIKKLEENEQDEIWYKVVACDWQNSAEHKSIKYSVSYILGSELHKLTDYTILRKYSNKSEFMSEFIR